MMYAHSTKNDGVEIMVVASREQLSADLDVQMTEEDYLAYIQNNILRNDNGWVLITEHHIPADREFRNAWTLRQGTVVIDCSKAKEIQLTKLRAARESSLKQLDIMFMQALEENDAERMAVIVAEKNRLRHITDPLINLDTEGTVGDDFMIQAIQLLGNIAQAERRIE